MTHHDAPHYVEPGYLQGAHTPEPAHRTCVTMRHVRHASCVIPHYATLEALAARVAALGISRHDPEAFHLQKDDVAKALRRLARELRRAA